MPTVPDLSDSSTPGPSRDGGVALLEVSDKRRRKAHGIHYTPPPLAAYLARQVINGLKELPGGIDEISILDPACGEGELLNAIVEAAPQAWRSKLRLVGFDKDGNAVERARSVIGQRSVASLELHAADFLSTVGIPESSAQMEFAQPELVQQRLRMDTRFHAVISNPPYVRTQVMGSSAAQELAIRFRLTGRVDLYHAFVKAMTLTLREGGILGLLTSNRFLTVQSGNSMRGWLLEHFRLRRLVDLGDTKLFEAAVLPAIVVAERISQPEPQDCEFIRVYESPEHGLGEPRQARSILDALDGTFAGHARVNGLCFHIETGKLQTGANNGTPWCMSNAGVDSWIATVKAHSSGTFADVAKICVGIKTTADSVFIRDDWEALPAGERPEAELLHPLFTHHLAARWHLPANTSAAKRVLYPYTTAAEERTPIDLADFPQARAYLLKHRSRLENRNYVIESGRQWYEVWVPHRPKDWTKRKLAFPDISETSKFSLIEPGWIVNGDCYWTKLLPGQDASWLLLMLAVANSTFVLKFYDAVFHNKLYSGRRRFMSQYVSRFPLPKTSRAKQIIELVPEVLSASAGRKTEALECLENELDSLVWKAFGLSKEVAR